jgi:deoxyribose-phosphate aldolase
LILINLCVWLNLCGDIKISTTISTSIILFILIDYYKISGYKVGFKQAGGIRTAKDACVWLTLMKEELEWDEWTSNKFFRLGASALLGDIKRQIYHYVTGRIMDELWCCEWIAIKLLMISRI